LDNVPLKDVNSHLQNYFNLTVEEVTSITKEFFDPEKLIVISCGESTSAKLKGSNAGKKNEEKKK
jgi:hypothetical protein